MSRVRTTILAITIAASFMAVLPSDANADGPLRQWLRGIWRPNAGLNANAGGGGLLGNCCGNRAAAPVATTANYAPNPYNLQPGQCMKTCQKTCSRTVVNYVPYTAYRTAYKRVPVTQYRPETKSDPCTGCTVTCMKPCTTYTYQCQRVPYTTYRPVYRQETYKVPVTTITNDCATGTCGPCNTAPAMAAPVAGCNTCVGGGFANQAPVLAPGNYAPTTNYAPTPAGTTTNYMPSTTVPPAPTTSTFYEEVPTGTLSPQGATYGTGTGYSAPTPANQTPALQGINPMTSQRPFLDRFNKTQSFGATNYQTGARREVEENAPARFNIEDKTAMSPVRKQWGYSPVRTASFTKPTTTRVQMAPISRPRSNDLNGWKEVN